MRFVAVLNEEGGTLRTANLDEIQSSIKSSFAACGHQVATRIVAGKGLEAAIDEALSQDDVDGVVIGGGDGSVSCAAGKLMNTDKVLAVLPAGTMNLFARSLKIPLELDAAIDALAKGQVRAVDIATANGRPFVHQYSIGMHAKLVHLREQREFASRIGKIMASTRAAWDTVLHPPKIKVKIELQDGTEIDARTSSIGITNNLYGEGHIPYTDTPDGGTLGIYITKARSRQEMMMFLAKMALGRWKTNPQVEIHEATEVKLTVLSSLRRLRCVVDGELLDIEQTTNIEIHPGVLKVVMPRSPEADGDQ